MHARPAALAPDFDDFDAVAHDIVRRARLRAALWRWYDATICRNP